VRYSLAQLVRRTRNPRRRTFRFRPVALPSTLASDLYASSYAAVIAVWSEAAKRVVAEYERTLALTTDSPADIGAVLTAVENDVTRLLVTVRLRLQEWAARVERLQRQKWRAAVQAATDVDAGGLLGADDVLPAMQASLERNTGLIRSISEQARTRIGEIVFAGFQKRRPAREVAKEIGEAVAMGKRRARNLAADQTAKLGAALNSERRRQAGIDTWEWISSHKVNYRPEHQARDGKRYSDDDAPADLPGELPYCGCTERAVLSLDSEF
jgi:SPP1 gp7 family putative phage head morphogenesis protein